MIDKILSQKKDGAHLVYFMETDLARLLKKINEDVFIEDETIDSIKAINETVSQIKNNEFLPSFALAGKMSAKSDINDDVVILDGFKKLVQLKKLYEVSRFYQKNKEQINEIKVSFKLRRFFRENFKKGSFSSNYIVVAKECDLVPSDFKKQQWFLFWNSLSKNEIAEKILSFQENSKELSLMERIVYILGHVFNVKDSVNYYKFKDIGINYFYSKKNVGDIHEGLLAVALISLACARLEINNCECKRKYDKIEFEKRLKTVVKEEVVRLLIDILLELDEAAYKRCGAEAVKILGKKSVVAELFGMAGKHLGVILNRETSSKNVLSVLRTFSSALVEDIEKVCAELAKKKSKAIQIAEF